MLGPFARKFVSMVGVNTYTLIIILIIVLIGIGVLYVLLFAVIV